MRRSASEVLRNLENRIARLERVSFHSKADQFMDYLLMHRSELKSITLSSKKSGGFIDGSVEGASFIIGENPSNNNEIMVSFDNATLDGYIFQMRVNALDLHEDVGYFNLASFEGQVLGAFRRHVKSKL